MAPAEVTSGESASIIDRIKHYAMSLAINGESDSTALHVFLMRCDGPFIPRLPEQGEPVVLAEEGMGRRCEWMDCWYSARFLLVKQSNENRLRWQTRHAH